MTPHIHLNFHSQGGHSVKILIVGRTATGKDTLKEILEQEFGWNFVKSMTTRPKRHPDEDTHIFITEEEAKQYKQEDKAAWTKIGPYEYFATKQQVRDCDAYIIDPKGVETIIASMPEEHFRIIYLIAANEDTREEMALKRAHDPEREIEIYRKRKADEDEQFTAFENKLHQRELSYPNCQTFLEFQNDFKKSTLEMLATKLEMSRTFIQNIKVVIQTLINIGIMNHDEHGTPLLLIQNEKGETETRTLPIELVADILETDPTMLGDMVGKWMSLPDIDLTTLG